MKFIAIVETRRIYRVAIEASVEIHAKSQAYQRAQAIRLLELPLVGQLEEAEMRVHSIVEDKS